MFCLRFSECFGPGIPSYSTQHGNIFAGIRLLCALNNLLCVCVRVDDKNHIMTQNGESSHRRISHATKQIEAGQGAAEWSQSN